MLIRALPQLLLACFLFLPACTDKAKADYDKCVRLEQEGKLEQAIDACKRAYEADRDSEYGEKARLKIGPLIQKQHARREAELLKLRAEAEAQRNKIAELKRQLAGAKSDEERAELEAKLAAERAKGANGKKGPQPKCAPGDPLCSEL